MAVSNDQNPNLTPSYGLITRQLENQANLELQRKNIYDAGTTVVDRVDKELTNQRDYAQKIGEVYLQHKLNLDLNKQKQDFEARGDVVIDQEAQDNFKNEFGFDSPFKVGDHVPIETIDKVKDSLTKSSVHLNKIANDKKYKELINNPNLLEDKNLQVQLLSVVDKEKNPELAKAIADKLFPKPNANKLRITTLPDGTKVQITEDENGAAQVTPITEGGRILPAAAVKELSDFSVLQKQNDLIGNSYKKLKDVIGPVASPLAKVQQQLGPGASEEVGTLLANLTSIRNQIIYLRSGKQINEAEGKRLLDELPNEKTSFKDFEAKYKNFVKVSNELLNTRAATYKSAGYRIPENLDFTRLGISSNGPKILSVKKKS